MQNLKYPFPCNFDYTSHSQVGQDLFVLSMLRGKQNGKYIEIGAGPAIETSNTYLLEKSFNWKGVAVENSLGFYNEHIQNRKHHIELADATTVDYTKLLLDANITDTVIDYVSLDIDSENTFLAMLKLPFDTHQFSVITFEHDCYAQGPEFKIKSREFLKSQGFILFAGSIQAPLQFGNGDFEDWWIHPNLVDSFFVENRYTDENTVKSWQSVILV